VRIIDFGARGGGILHAKYFVVDGVESFVGSQNFDWRALAHIFEIGVRVRSAPFAGELSDVFETDWALAAGGPAEARVHAHPRAAGHARTGESFALFVDPKGWLPDESAWDLPRLVALVDGATRSVDLQVLTYKTKDRAGDPFPTLDLALRRAAARGVLVRVLASSWSEKGDARAALEALARVPNVKVEILTVPPFSGGEIPFARVAHAKYMVVDRAAAWIGTSNWEGDYFTRSRNLAVVVEGGPLPGKAERVFEDGWSSAYVAALSGRADAAPPSSSGPAPR
jgi:phosphatidylserine/phosphatidylglycerophosphate/cardiolipin synthase-like enzyme